MQSELVLVGWWLPEMLRPERMSDYEWETERIVTTKMVEMEGGIRSEFVGLAVPLYAKTQEGCG